MSLSRFLRAVTPEFGVQAVRRLMQALDPFANVSYSQEGEDMIHHAGFVSGPQKNTDRQPQQRRSGEQQDEQGGHQRGAPIPPARQHHRRADYGPGCRRQAFTPIAAFSILVRVGVGFGRDPALCAARSDPVETLPESWRRMDDRVVWVVGP